MSNPKRFATHFLYSVFILSIVLYGENYRLYLRAVMGRTFKILPMIIFIVVFPVVVGLLLALPSYIVEYRKEGKWRYDWTKFIAIAIPALYVILSLPTPFRNLLAFVYPPPLGVLLMQPQVLHFAAIALGYFGLSALYKEASVDTDVNV